MHPTSVTITKGRKVRRSWTKARLNPAVPTLSPVTDSASKGLDGSEALPTVLTAVHFSPLGRFYSVFVALSRHPRVLAFPKSWSPVQSRFTFTASHKWLSEPPYSECPAAHLASAVLCNCGGRFCNPFIPISLIL